MSVLGSVIGGKYAIRALVAKGGMGAVYEAEHVDLGRSVAVKILPIELASSPESRARFEREAKAAGRIEHDHICEVFDFGVDVSGLPYFVMPLLKGESLRDAIAHLSPFSIHRSLDITEQILAALQAAHQAGVIHRDLKPSNVFLTCVGGREDFVKVLDFGISKPLGDGEGEEEDAITKSGVVLGTPAYMAPEQARGAKDVDRRVDVYAAGVVLYEMLTGERPVGGESYNEVLWNIWNANVKPVRSFRRDVSQEVEDIVLRAMRRDRDQRFGSVADFGDALERVRSIAASSRALETLDTIETDVALTPASSHHSARWPIWPVVLLVGLTTVVLGAVALRHTQESPSTAPANQRSTLPLPASTVDVRGSESAAMDAGDTLALDGSSEEPESSPHVRISLTDVPPEGIITLDDQVFPGPSFEVPASKKAARLEVRAPGYEPWARDIVLDGSLEIHLKLKREPFAKGRSKKALSKALKDTVPVFGGMP